MSCQLHLPEPYAYKPSKPYLDEDNELQHGHLVTEKVRVESQVVLINEDLRVVSQAVVVDVDMGVRSPAVGVYGERLYSTFTYMHVIYIHIIRAVYL